MVIIEKQEKYPAYMFPTNDFMFKKIFGTEGKEDITKDLVSSIIGRKIKELELKNLDLSRDDYEDKNEVLDIKAVLDNDILCDIEVQIASYHDIDKRILDYWAKMYRTSIQKEDDSYINMKKTIIILIADFNLDKLKEIEEYKTEYEIMEKNHKIRLSDVFRVVII